MGEGERNQNAAQSGSTVSVSFHNPLCISFGEHFYTDIHSVSAMIEALNTAGYEVGAMRLTVALSFALVAFYKSLFFGFRDVNSLPISARCFLGTVHKIGLKPEENGESPMEFETSHEKANNGLAWPEGHHFVYINICISVPASLTESWPSWLMSGGNEVKAGICRNCSWSCKECTISQVSSRSSRPVFTEIASTIPPSWGMCSFLLHHTALSLCSTCTNKEWSQIKCYILLPDCLVSPCEE